MKTDILILFEHRSREAENVGLLMSELERRGYKVKASSIFSPLNYFTKSKLLITPHLYNDDQLVFFAKNFWMSNKKILSLQYEQVLANGRVQDPNDVHKPSGQALFAHHVAWGMAQKERYMKCGIPSSHIHVTGCISMDLMRNEFDSYFYDRDEIAQQFHLDNKKEWVLFISSFAFAKQTPNDISRQKTLYSEADRFSVLSDQSYYPILEWLKQAAKDYPQKLFIYRKHPAEKDDRKLSEIEKECKNFRCIDTYSMRQWIRVVDRTYNWYSTSLVDAFFGNKPCELLRPVEIPWEFEIDLFEALPFIKNYQCLKESLSAEVVSMDKCRKKIEYYYGDAKEKMAYIKLANLCEDLIERQDCEYDFEYGDSRFNMRNSESILSVFSEWIKIPIFLLFCLFHIKEHNFMPPKMQYRLRVFSKDVYGVNSEIERYKERFKNLII